MPAFISRRTVLSQAATAAAALVALPALAGDKTQGTSITPPATTAAPAVATPAATVASGPFTLPALPYADTDLTPAISQNTIGFHYGKHHQGYVNKLNELVVGKEWASKSLDDVVKGTYGTESTSIYNNSAQIWNHTFYWNSMKKAGGGAAPAGKLADAIKAAFGDHEGFKKEFTAAATGQFGSGWAWLVVKEGKLAVVKTANADSPGVTGAGTPLLVCDVWEHAYYLDYQNRRNEYVTAWLDKAVNWDFAAKNLG